MVLIRFVVVEKILGWGLKKEEFLHKAKHM